MEEFCDFVDEQKRQHPSLQSAPLPSATGSIQQRNTQQHDDLSHPPPAPVSSCCGENSLCSDASLFGSWQPQGKCVSVTGELDLSCLEQAAVTGSGWILRYHWAKYKATGRREESAAYSFADCACMMGGRKDQHVLWTTIGEMIEHFPSFNDATYLKLAFVITELPAEPLARQLFEKAKQETNTKSVAFYTCLLRHFTETAPGVDLSMATTICDEMSRRGLEYSPVSLRLLLHGLSRTPQPSIAMATRIMDFRLANAASPADVELSLLHKFMTVMETAIGDEAMDAAKYIKNMDSALVHSPIDGLAPSPPKTKREGVLAKSDGRTIYICDALNIDFDQLNDGPPEGGVVFFLYSTLRTTAERSLSVCPSHRVNNVIIPEVKRLTTPDNLRFCVCAPEVELICRGTSTTIPPQTTDDKILALARGFKLGRDHLRKVSIWYQGEDHTSDNLQVKLLTKSQQLARRAAVFGVPSGTTYF